MSGKVFYQPCLEGETPSASGLLVKIFIGRLSPEYENIL